MIAISLQVYQSEQNTNDADDCIKRRLGNLNKNHNFLKTAISEKKKSRCFPLDDGICYIIMKVTSLRN